MKAKFYVEHPWVGGTKVCSRDLGHMTKMAATPIYTVKSLINARAFIRIIVHFAEGGGRLLEAIVFCKTHSEV